MEIPVVGMVLCVIALLYRIWLQGHQREQRERQQLPEQQTKLPKQDKQKNDQDKQKEIQNLLYEVSTELKDLDQRLKDDDQFEAAAKEFIDLYKRTNFDWILDHKNYDSLDFKELANKTGEIYGALIKTPKLKIPIEKAAAEKKKAELIKKREEEVRGKRIARKAAGEERESREEHKRLVAEEKEQAEQTAGCLKWVFGKLVPRILLVVALFVWARFSLVYYRDTFPSDGTLIQLWYADDGDYVKLGTIQTFYEESYNTGYSRKYDTYKVSYKGGKLAKDRDFFLERQMKRDSRVCSHDTRNGFHNGGQHPTRIVNYMRRKWGKTKPDDIIHRNVAIYNKPSAGNMPSEDSRGKGSAIGVIMLPFVLSAIWLATLLRKTKKPSAATSG